MDKKLVEEHIVKKARSNEQSPSATFFEKVNEIICSEASSKVYSHHSSQELVCLLYIAPFFENRDKNEVLEEFSALNKKMNESKTINLNNGAWFKEEVHAEDKEY